MKKKICFFLLLFLIVVSPKKIYAYYCSDDEMIRLQKLAQNVKISYIYNEQNNKFTIIITNLKKDLKIKYLNYGKIYSTDKEISIENSSSGKHSFMIYSNVDCSKEYIMTKYIDIPYYNFYYKSSYCEKIENYIYCSKWLNKNINITELIEKTTEYKKEINNKKQEEIKKNKQDNTLYNIFYKIKDIYIEKYYIILPVIISVLCLIIYIKNKKNDLV